MSLLRKQGRFRRWNTRAGRADKRAAEAQRQLQGERDELLGRLQLQFERMPIACIIFDTKGHITDWNPAAEKIFGYPRHEVVGRSGFSLLVPPTSHPQAQELVRRLAAGDMEAHSVIENRTKQGRIILCEWHNTPLQSPEGQVIGVLSMALDITERKQAERALIDSEGKFRTLADASPAMIWFFDPRGENSFANRPLLEFFGMSEEQLLGIGWQSLLHPDDAPAYLAALRDAVREHRPVRCRARVRRADQTWRWIESQALPHFGPDGRYLAHVGHCLDITDSLEATAALLQSEKNLATELAAMARLQQVSTRLVQAGDSTSLLVEILEAAIAIIGADMGCIQLFDRDSGTLKIVASRGLHSPFLEFFNTAHQNQGACGAAMHSGKRVVIGDVTQSLIFVGTPSLPVMLAAQARAVQSTPLVSRSGHLLGILSTHYRAPRRPADRDLHFVDLLARQAADWIERTQAEEALRASEQRFRRTFECNMVPMGVWNKGGAIVEANDALLNLMGYTRDDLTAGQLNWKKLTPPEKHYLDEPAAVAIRTKGVGPSYEQEFIHKDGRRIPILCGGAAFTGTADSGIFFAIDLTELRDRERAHKTLEVRADDATTANRTKDEFLAMLGHELRNPLSPIVTALRLMRLRGAVSKEQDILERQVRHLTRLVDDLLDVSRITRGKIELRKERLELANIVLQAIETVSPLLEQRSQRLDVSVPRNGLGVEVDPDRMEQVILNLVTNAAKYSDPGSLIRIAAAKEGDSVRIRVRDQGVGITPEMIGRVFDLFVQQPQTTDRSRGGLGLGLAIVQSLVRLHGGSVSAHSDGLGKGSEFVIELPAMELVGAKSTPPVVANVSGGPVETDRRERILVVDDNVDAAMTLAWALEELGYVVKVAYDGPEALVTAQNWVPELALIDIGLPVMDGYELALRLRQQAGRKRKLQLVAVTGYGQEADYLHSEQAGFASHMVKPVDLSKLARVIEELLHQA